MKGLFLSIIILIFFPLVSYAPSHAAALESKAAGLAVGVWTRAPELETGLTNSLVYRYSSGILVYANHGVWDPINKEAIFVAGHHMTSAECQTVSGDPGCTNYLADCCAGQNEFIYFEDASDQWKERNTGSSAPVNIGHSLGHVYDHNAIDPVTGDVYIKQFNATPSTGYGVYQWDRSSGTWAGLHNPQETTFRFNGASTSGVAWFPEFDNGTAIPGALILFGNDYDHARLAWWNPRITPGPGNDYAYTKIHEFELSEFPGQNNIAEYDPVNKLVVFGGGGGAGTHLYSLNAAGTYTRLADSPTQCSSQGMSVVTIDPVSGKLLLWAPHIGYELDLSDPGNSWVQLSSSNPDHDLPFTLSGDAGLQVVFPISSYGVIMMIDHWTGTPRAWLYKHETSSTYVPTGPAATVNSIGINVSPNPFSAATTITFSGAYHNSSLSILSINGKLIRRIEDLSSKDIVLNAENLSTGIYILKLRTGNKQYSKTLFIQK